MIKFRYKRKETKENVNGAISNGVCGKIENTTNILAVVNKKDTKPPKSLKKEHIDCINSVVVSFRISPIFFFVIYIDFFLL